MKTSTFDHVHWTNKVKHQFRNDNTLFDYDMLHYLRLKVRAFIQHSFTQQMDQKSQPVQGIPSLQVDQKLRFSKTKILSPFVAL